MISGLRPERQTTATSSSASMGRPSRRSSHHDDWPAHAISNPGSEASSSYSQRNLYGGVVPTLIAPREDMRRSFAEAMDEFRAEGRGSADDSSAIGDYLRTRAAEWSSDEAFSLFAASIRADALEQTPRPEGYVPATEFWWVDGETFLGRITIRHRLTPHLLEVGGHIGYDVRPSARRRGHATEMLRQTLADRSPDGDRPGSDHLRRRQHRLANGHRAQRRCARGRACWQTPLLGPDRLTSSARIATGAHPASSGVALHFPRWLAPPARACRRAGSRPGTACLAWFPH